MLTTTASLIRSLRRDCSRSLKAANYLISKLNMATDAKNDVTGLYGLNQRYEPVGDKNVWVEFTQLARDHSAINLGQGFPDYMSVPYLVDTIKETVAEPNALLYQYTRSAGHPRLVNAIAKVYGKFMNREIEPLTEVLVTNGAYGSLFNAITAFLNPGEEMIIIEPFFDCYAPMAVSAQAKCRYVPLRPKKKAAAGEVTTTADWSWDDAELEGAFNSKTKVILINTPNNPLGKVYTKEELEQVAKLCIKWNCICISDEVYEHITYDRPHLRMASLPGMWERTVTIGSAGKTFSSTGSKIGWTVGCKELLRLCQVVHNNSVYCIPTFIQEVLARCFELELPRLDSPECYFKSISAELRPKRDQIAKLLQEAGLTPVIPEGGYFIMADISNIAKEFATDEKECKDSKFVKYLIREKGLATIPSTAFYSNEHKPIGENYIRFCFFKADDTLEKAAKILKNFNKSS